MIDRIQFQQHCQKPDSNVLVDAVKAARRGDADGRTIVCAALTWAAFSCPEATGPVYDQITSAWLGQGPTPDMPDTFEQAPLEDSFWTSFWAVIDDAEQGYDASSITVAVASLGGAVHPRFGELAELQARSHPGANQAATRQVPGLTDIEALEACAPDTLGHRLYELLTVNGFDAEVLDRNAIMLNALPPALRYLNTRILQMHDVWHLVAGYETTGTQEIAISAFQLAQFGHNYSSMFLAVVTMISHDRNPRGYAILMQLIAEAWQHGRQTPGLMAIEWEEEWHTPIDQIRQKYGIEPLHSALPANLMETLGDGSLMAKLQLGWRLLRFSRQLQLKAA